MSCEDCRGACCETFALAIDLSHVDAETRRWVDLHYRTEAGQRVLDARCQALTPEGRCGVYADRPAICREYEVGGPDCVAVRAARRSR